MPSPLRAALFLRISTDAQHLDCQRPEVVALARQRGYEVVEVYEEIVSSVAKVRPAHDRMRLDAHKGKFDVVVVWALDRLGRSMTGNLQAVLDLDRLGVQLVSVREPWLDTSGPVRPLLIAIFGWVAEQERLRIVERTKAGIENARRAGKTIGRPRVTIDLDRAVKLRRDGRSLRQMARALGIGASTLHRALTAHDEVERARGAGAPTVAAE